jgi:hypothetical protein
MTLKFFITELEYDNLNQYEQMKFTWCNNCNMFYRKDETKCICELYKEVNGIEIL